MKNNQIIPLLTLLCLLLFAGCGGEDSSGEGTSDTDESTEFPDYSYSNNNNKGDIDYEPGPMPEYKSSDLFQELYSWSEPIAPPSMDYSMDLKGKSLEELHFLRYEIMARNGFMFIDDILRQRYQGEIWYQPIYDNMSTDWEVSLTPEEQSFVDRVQAAEETLLAHNYIEKDGKMVVNPQNIINRFSFHPELLADIDPYLEENAFAIVPAKHEQLFHLYDANDYDGVPPFVTTDLYLQVFHIYFSYLLRDLEEKKFAGVLEGLVKDMHAVNQTLASSATEPTLKSAAEYNMMYFALSYKVLTEKDLNVPEAFQENFTQELTKVNNASGQGSKFLKAEFFDYSLFKPRGHYTRTPELTRYFKAMMWLQTAPANPDHPEAMNGALLSAVQLHRGKNAQGNSLMEVYNSLFDPIMFIVGQPNQLGPRNVIEVMKARNLVIEDLVVLEGDNPEIITNDLKSVDLGGFKKVGANAETRAELDKVSVFFMPQRYTFDAEILSRLVNIERMDTKEPPVRPVPKGLDVFAALNSPQAESILIDVYKEAENWPGYTDTLRVLKEKFQTFDKWDANMYNKWMSGLKKLSAKSAKYPFYMKTAGWEKKNLYTALASWTELKHDVILYADQPVAAEMGDGGDWPDPVLKGVVEPNITFWKNCVELCDLTEAVFQKYNLFDENLATKNKKLRELAQQMADYSQKQLNDEPLTAEEYDNLRFIGGAMEALTLRVMDSEVWAWYEIEGPDKFIAVVADVYTYQGEGKQVALEEAVGYGDEIYVVVEFDGYLYLARGATLSYYEFEQPINERLTDEEWQAQVKDGKLPERPEWTQSIILQP